MTRGPAPPSLGSASSQAEGDEAAAFYADPANRDRGFPFRAYAADDVKLALKEMFNGKCAYCETAFAAGGPLSTEHYRPKGEWSDSDGKVEKPGYYWLAGDWENLLTSCWDCNCKRGHEYPDGRRVTGKAIQFPLLDESRRATGPGTEHDEEPFLLDPCRDDPDQHLEFAGDGAVKPAQTNGRPSARGERTIEILGLHRPDLSKLRMNAFVGIEAAIVVFEETLEDLDANPDDPVLFERLKRRIRELIRLMADEAPYAAMARQHIVPVLRAAGVEP